MGIRNFLKFYFRKFLLRVQAADHKALTMLARQALKANLADSSIRQIQQTEFQVFSQYGEDGIIQYLINKIEIPKRIFIEFGVEDYTESNTRFLLTNNNWSGLVIDGSESNIRFIQQDHIYWRHNLQAVSSFITRENINDLFAKAGISGDIGLLSVDIDGNDYWVWDAITSVNPRIVIAEYNSVLGPTLRITTPYDPSFVRGKAHHSHLYFGASLAALCDLATKKGYYFIGCNSNGNNAFFIRNDITVPFPRLTASEGYVPSQFRESKNERGELTFLSGDARLKAISHLEFFDLDSGKQVVLNSIL